MSDSQVTTANLHYTIIKHIIDRGYAPDVNGLAQLLKASEEEVTTVLNALQDDHGVVLHPNSHKIWVIHPFALAPTHFWVQANDRGWWGNCAWCSLGVAALVKQNITILTSSGAQGEPLKVNIRDGHLVETDLLVHFPIPMKQAWDNVLYTCSTMLLFKHETEIDVWTQRHQIPKGDVRSLANIWEFAKVWYGNHLNPEWKKWTAKEAKSIFDRFHLTGPIWEIPVSESSF